MTAFAELDAQNQRRPRHADRQRRGNVAATWPRFTRNVAPGGHAALRLDGAGHHIAEDLKLPPNITLVHLPPYAPELNPMENVREYLRCNQLAITVFHSCEDILDTACNAWMFFENDKERIATR